MLRERRWLLSIVLCVTLSVTMLWTPMYAQAADNDSGQTTENTFINSDGAAAYMADGFAYRYIDEDGYFNSDGTMPDGEGISIRIIGYYGQGTKIDIPEKIDGYDVTEVRWSKNYPSGVSGEIDYDKVTEITIPSKVTSYRRLYSAAQQSFTVAEDNTDFAAKDGVLYGIDRYVDEGHEYAYAYLKEYPRSRPATEYSVPEKVKDASVDSVDFYDFKHIDSCLESISIPAGVETIDAENCISTLKEVVVDPDNKNYRSEDGVLFDTGEGTEWVWNEEEESYTEKPVRNNNLILYPAAKAGEKYTVPDGVKKVCDYSFRNTMVKTIVFPSSVTYIDMDAFNDSSVTEMVFLSKTAPELYDRCEPFEGRSVKITYPEGASGYEKLEAMAAGRNNYWEEDWYSGDEIPLGANISYYMRYVPYKGEVVFKYSTDEDGPFTEAAPDKEGEYYVKAVVAETESYIGLESDVQCYKFVAADGEQKDNAIEINCEMYWDYDGKAHSASVTSIFGTPVVTYTPYVWDEAAEDYVLDASKATTTPPTEAGEYLVKASVEGTDDYMSAEESGYMYIYQASNKWLEKLSCTDVEEGTAPAPSAKAAFGEVKYLYSDTATGEFTATVPKALGDHYVKAVVDETNNYEGLESAPVQFTIKQKVEDPGQGETGGNNGQNTPGKQDGQIDDQGGKTPAPAQTVAKKANTMRVVFKNKTIKAKKLKKKAFAYKAVKVTAAKGAVVYTVKPIGKKAKKALKFNKKTGKIKIKKKTKRGVYKMKITVKAKGNAQYKASKKFTKTIKVKVK